MKNMTVIPSKPQKGNSAAKEEVQRLRVAAYCRVSTDNEEQASSYEAQIQHYEEFIKTNPEWEFVGVYADEGISATSTKNREQFNAMIEGKMNCAVEHTPNFGETLMETAKKIVAGEEVPATIELEEGIFPADIAEQELPNRTY